MPWAAWAVPAAVGALGVYNANKNANAARHAGEAALKPQLSAQNDLLKLGEGYNPQAEDAMAIQRANEDAGATFTKSLKELNGNFTAAGGQPTGDTAFNVNATNAGNRAIDPLRAFTTSLLSTQTQRKADMLGRVFGAPAGQIANSYFQIANGAQAGGDGAMMMFLQGLKNMPWFNSATGSGMSAGDTANRNSAGNVTYGAPPASDGGTWNADGTYSS